MQEHCEGNDLPTAQGWEKLQAKLEEEAAQSRPRATQISEALAEVFREVLSVGNRAVQVFRFEPEEAVEIADYLATLQPEDSPYFDSYPLPLAADALAAMPSGVFLCEVRADAEPHSVTLVFCGRRMVEDKEPRTRAEIGDAAINQFGWEQYDEFVLIKRRFVQSYEVVRIDVATGLMELRVEDQPGADGPATLSQLQVKANGILAAQFALRFPLVSPLNLFPAIKSMYDDAAEGIVVELGFTTATGSAKHEKMRTNRADLRVELFHVGGKAAIHGALTPFRVAVRWSKDGDRMQEEALLPGTIRQVAIGVTPYLDHMLLSGSLTEAKMRATVQKVLKHVP